MLSTETRKCQELTVEIFSQKVVKGLSRVTSQKPTCEKCTENN